MLDNVEPLSPDVEDMGVDYEEQVTASALFSGHLEKQLSETVRQRDVIDQRMIEDLRMYHGMYDEATQAALDEADRSKVFMNLVRAKTNAGESQMVDLLFQASDKNYGLSPTPKPELVAMEGDHRPYQNEDGEELEFADDGSPVEYADIARRQMTIAKEKACAMETLIEDQLVESDYSSKARIGIHDACTVGTGVLKGPVVNGRLRRSYKRAKDEQGNSIFEAELEQVFQPGVEVVRPWDFFPDMSAAHIQECEFVYERRHLSRKQVRDLRFRKGYNEDAIRKVLKMQPKETQHRSTFVDDVRVLAGLSDDLNDTRYELWEYHGPIPSEVLLEWDLISEEQADDPLAETTGVVHFCGGVILSVRVHMMDFDYGFPYRPFNWEVNDSSIFGFGIPRICRDPQEVLNSTARMMLDNAAITAGPQIGVDRSKASPMDNNWELKPFKMWDLKRVTDINQVFTKMEFNSHLPELQGIYAMARVLLDEMSGIPMLQQGEQGQVTETLGGMSMLMNAANAVRRRQVKFWDDNVTKPLIRDFYHFNMLHADDDEVKGDYEVHARGTTALLVKEQTAQSITNFLGMVSSSEVFSPVLMMKSREILEAWVNTQNLPKELVPTKREFNEYMERMEKQRQEENDDGGPVNPQLEVEKVRLEQLAVKHEHERMMADQAREFEIEKTRADYTLRGMQLEEQREHRSSAERLEMMRLAQQDKISQDKLMIELEKIERKSQDAWAQRELETQLKAIYGKRGNYGID